MQGNEPSAGVGFLFFWSFPKDSQAFGGGRRGREVALPGVRGREGPRVTPVASLQGLLYLFAPRRLLGAKFSEAADNGERCGGGAVGKPGAARRAAGPREGHGHAWPPGARGAPPRARAPHRPGDFSGGSRPLPSQPGSRESPAHFKAQRTGFRSQPLFRAARRCSGFVPEVPFAGDAQRCPLRLSPGAPRRELSPACSLKRRAVGGNQSRLHTSGGRKQ